MNFNKLGSNVYFRINFTRRGNYLGNFLDFGASVDWTFAMRHFTKEKTDNIITKTRSRGYDYYNPLNYHVFARIGFNRYVLSGSYRLSDVFKNKYNYPELAKITVGLEIGLFDL